MKKCIAILLCIIPLLLSSCESYENMGYVYENEEKYLLYQNEKYYKSSIFTVTEHYGIANNNDVQLGWYYSFPFSTYSYSETSEKPIYIYTIGGEKSLYFRQDYNYSTDTFVIHNSTVEIVWEDIFHSKQKNFHFEQPTTITLYSKQYPRIKTYLELVCVENQWYLSLPNFQGVWTPSDEFIKILSDNGLFHS